MKCLYIDKNQLSAVNGAQLFGINEIGNLSLLARPVYETINVFDRNTKLGDRRSEDYTTLRLLNEVNNISIRRIIRSVKLSELSSYNGITSENLIGFEVFLSEDPGEVLVYEKLEPIFEKFKDYNGIIYYKKFNNAIKSDIQNAIEQVEDIRTQYGDNAIVCFILCICYYFNKDFNNAIRLAEKCVMLKVSTVENDIFYLIVDWIRKASKEIQCQMSKWDVSAKKPQVVFIKGMASDDGKNAKWQETIDEVVNEAYKGWTQISSNSWKGVVSEEKLKPSEIFNSIDDNTDTVMVFAHGDMNAKEQDRFYLKSSQDKEIIYFHELANTNITRSNTILFMNCFTPHEQAKLFSNAVIASTGSIHNIYLYCLSYAYFFNRLVSDDIKIIYFLSSAFSTIFTDQGKEMYLKVSEVENT